MTIRTPHETLATFATRLLLRLTFKIFRRMLRSTLLRREVVRGLAGLGAGSESAPNNAGRSVAASSARVPQQFTTAWAKEFSVRALLQALATTSADAQAASPARQPASPVLTQARLLDAQRRLSERWDIAPVPLEAASAGLLFTHLGQFCLGERTISHGALRVLDHVCGNELGLGAVSTPSGMRSLLELAGFVRPGDNLRRLVSGAPPPLPPEAHAMAADFARAPDAYAELRLPTHHNVFAIDSATTSEVDDAIGIHVDPETGIEWITVYVSDATTNCPFDSAMERASARELMTTTYLPEGVSFMLPHAVVEAATLRIDQPCRTFDIRFRMDTESGAVFDYSVGVGVAHALRRITYDDVQALYDAAATGAPPPASRPSWLTADDEAVLHRILRFAHIRADARRRGRLGVSTSLPEPLVKVDGTRVEYVKDQILCTKDARLAVAELMVAANEVCARVAQELRQPIAFRGSRPPSTNNEAAREFAPPMGLAASPAAAAAATTAATTSAAPVISFGESIFRDLEQLRGVTRAIYAPTPLHHNGLGTDFYCHSTSPLRRYPDMLVHHQLKVSVARQAGIRAEELIPEFQMATLCEKASRVFTRTRIMQKKSVRFWVLVHLRDNLLREQPDRLLRCLVGYTNRVAGCPEARTAVHMDNRGAEFSSDVYLPELQITHALLHSDARVVPGCALHCAVEAVNPMLDELRLRIVRVDSTASEDIERSIAPFATGDD